MSQILNFNKLKFVVTFSIWRYKTGIETGTETPFKYAMTVGVA